MSTNIERKIGIFTDAHGLLEPTKAALEDMTKKELLKYIP